MSKNNQSTNAFLIHISAFAGFIFPLGHIITPLIAWQTLKNSSSFLDEQGKEAVNFNLSYTLYTVIITLCFIPFAFGSFFREFISFNNFNFNYKLNTDYIFSFLGLGSLTSIIYLAGVILVIIASTKARDGLPYKYPFTIKFLK